MARLKAPLADSWDPMHQALPLALSGPDGKLYQVLFFEKKVKFQYPPTSLLFLYPIEHEPLAGGLKSLGISWLTIVDVISCLLIFATAFLVVWIYFASVEKARLPDFDKWNRLVSGLVWVCLTLTFYPIMRAYSLGQIQVWINALFGLLFLLWLKDRQRSAGVVVGLMCLIKPHYALLLVWGLLRRRWGFVLAGAATGALGLVLSLFLFGLGNHLDYLNVLSFLGKHGEAFFPNQSINGLLNRLLFNGDNLDWQAHTFPPYDPWVYYGTLASSLILLAAALFWPVPPKERGSATDLALMTLAATIASPVAWEHHYGILLPIYAFLVPCLARKGWALAVLAFSYILTSNFLEFVNRWWNTPFNFVQSYLLAGALMVLVLLFRVRSRGIIGQKEPA
jgi:hypothetical protein